MFGSDVICKQKPLNKQIVGFINLIIGKYFTWKQQWYIEVPKRKLNVYIYIIYIYDDEIFDLNPLINCKSHSGDFRNL